MSSQGDRGRQDYRNLLVELAYQWAHIEEEVRVANKRLGEALAKATRVEALWDEFDADSGLAVGDAEDIMREEAGDFDWKPRRVDVVGFYVVRFDARNVAASLIVHEDRELGGAIARYAPQAMSHVVVGTDPAPLFLQGELCRRPVAVRGSRAPRVPKLKRGRHWLTPIEARFYDELKETGLVFGTQVPVAGPGRDYRPDFMVFYRGGALVVELDGHEAHKTRKQRQYDAEKDRWLERQGFRTARWTGTDVYANARACVAELVELVRGFERG